MRYTKIDTNGRVIEKGDNGIIIVSVNDPNVEVARLLEITDGSSMVSVLKLPPDSLKEILPSVGLYHLESDTIEKFWERVIKEFETGIDNSET